MKQNYFLKKIFFLFLLITSITQGQVIDDDFEDGDISGWTEGTASDWTNSTSSPITGSQSLKHNLSSVSGESYIYHDISSMNLSTQNISWQFNLANESWDPSGSNRFWVYLTANETDLSSSTVDGYAVGVNLSGSSDILTLWKVTNRSGVAIVSSTFNWGTNDTVGIKVTRSTSGEWELLIDSDGGFDSLVSAGTATNTDYTHDDYFGLFFDFTSSRAGKLRLDDVTVEGTAPSSDPAVSFVSSSSTVTETDATFNTNIPVNLTNYDANVTISIAVNGSSTAEAGDYTLNTTSLVFDTNETLNISLDINDDADNDDETVILDIAVSSGTANLSISQHTVTITDDELPNLIINEILADPDTSTGDANGDGSVSGSEDEFVELYNASGADLDISGYTLEDGFSVRHTFPQGTILPSSAVIVVFGGGTPTNIPSLSQVASTTALGLNNSGDTVTIKDASSTTVVEETYGNDGGDNEALARDPDLTGSFAKHSTITGNSIDFSPGRQNADNIPFSKTWTGGTDNDWTLASNWDTNSTPSSVSDNVWISSGASNYPTASGAVTVNSVTINSGASLIAQGTFTGTVTYNRNIPTTNWYLVSSPVVGQDIDAFVTTEGLASGTNGSNLGLSDYNNATPGWTYYQNGASGTGSFTSGDGRSIKLASQGDISFTGTINTSDVTLAMTSNSNGFNLVGNPYPSYVAGNENADGTNNILTINSANLTENTLWFWNQSTDSYNQINQASAAFQIAPAQGFFLSATGSVNLSITEAMQSHQGTDSFQRLTTRPEIELILSNGTATRNAEIYYIEGTTTGWDNGYDSSIFGGVANEFAIYTHAVANGNGRNLGIQSLPPNNYENMIIPVGINAEAGTSITIDAATNNFPSGINIYLEDKQDNSFTLLEAGSNFSLTPENSLSGIGRFYLHTTSSVLSADDFDTNNNISIYTSSNDNLRIAGVQNGTATVRLYNILGKEMLKSYFEGNGVNDINLNNIPVGIYIVKLTTENGTLNRKIIIQ